jgi:hypothetical protein
MQETCTCHWKFTAIPHPYPTCSSTGKSYDTDIEGIHPFLNQIRVMKDQGLSELE